MSHDSNPANAYLRTRVLTASPEELRLMLLDGAIKFAHQGRDGIAAKNYEASFNGISQARNIVLELITSVRPEHDPELCGRVKAVYSFMYNELVTASFERSIEKLDSVIRLLEFERETWVLLMQKLASERGAPAPAQAQPNSPLPAGPAPRAAISVQA